MLIEFVVSAILFLTEIDNICYAFGLGELARARVESAGRITLTAQEESHLVLTKTVWACSRN